jgi:hypothetical protein
MDPYALRFAEAAYRPMPDHTRLTEQRRSGMRSSNSNPFSLEEEDVDSSDTESDDGRLPPLEDVLNGFDGPASPARSSPPASPSRLARERERAREAAATEALYARAGMMVLPPHPLAAAMAARHRGTPPSPPALHVGSEDQQQDEDEDKRGAPRLRPGEPVFWHHLARGGEIPGVCDDRRARPPPPTAAARGPRARFQR